MVGKKLVFLLQAMAQIPGLEFMDNYATTIRQKSLAARSHKERALELKERGQAVGQAGKSVGGGEKSGKGGKGKPGQGGRGGAGPSGRGGNGGHGGTGGTGGRNDEWGSGSDDRSGLRRSPPSNTDRLRGTNDSGRDPQADRLRRKNYDL